jgi:hypothetical protein
LTMAKVLSFWDHFHPQRVDFAGTRADNCIMLGLTCGRT